MTLAALILPSLAFCADEIRVSDIGSLRAAVVQAKPGTRILVAPGDYAGGVYGTGVNGTADAPIVIAAVDPQKPPKFTGGFHFGAARYLEVRDLAITGANGNAIDVDDAGVRETPADHITLSGLHITDNPGGGSSAIKMAGVDDFKVEKCTIERFGGCGIDMVGCHKGLISGCRFETGGAVGVQAKGASSDVTIRQCAFRDAGDRGVNIGGSTGDPFYRPVIETIPSGSRYEAKNIVVEGCSFQGCGAPISFAGADGGLVRFNTFVDPTKWILRILQETSTPDVAPCRNGRFEDNIVVFRSDHWFEGGVNVGPKTAPDTFRFARNWWYCHDNPDRSRPTLPSVEVGGVIGRDPMVLGAALTLDPKSQARAAGAQALPTSAH